MSQPVVETAAGKLRGETVQGIHTFKGVPYAASTAGESRFQPPQPRQPWAGVRDALEFGPISPQHKVMITTPEVWEPFAISEDQTPTEDCLVLNVWTPGLGDGAHRPVLVWFHGGGFATGCGASTIYNGAALAQRGDAVVITVNHRLGVMGYLYLGAILGEEFADSGNAGILDLTAALRWVRDNISAFGGDPANVTIFGESGGGGKVHAQLTMAGSKGLFQRAVQQSGVLYNNFSPIRTPEMATRTAEALLKELGIAPGHARDVLSVPFEQLLAAQLKLPGGPMAGFGPVFDGRELPAEPREPAASSTSIPLLIGTTKDEFALMLAADSLAGGIDEAALRARIGPFARGREDAFISAYSSARPGAKPIDLAIAIISDGFARIPSIRTAERRVAAGTAPVFMYQFAYESPLFGGVLKSCHILDVPFVFNNVERVPVTGSAPERVTLSNAMSDAWLAFARSGNPNHSGLPAWPAYDAVDRSTMILSATPHVERDPRRDERLLWES
ncbi:MAG: carboxylesterase/lipase family protein [Chloroflexota bacterium]